MKAANFAPVKAPEYTTLEVIDLHSIFLNQTLTIDISLNLQDYPIQDTFTYRDFARDLFTMAQPLLGIPLAEFRRDVPPGWAPNLPDYSLKSYFDKLRLWYRLYQGPDEQVGPLLAGRLQGRAQKIAMGLKLVRPDGTYDVGDSALVRLSTDEVRDPMDPNVILQHAIPSGVQALANALRETFGQSDQELATHSLEQFFLFKRGKLSMHEYASEWELRYESAQRHSGLEINDVAKSFLFFQSSGLPNKFIEDVKIQIQGDMSRFEEAKRLTLRLSNRSDQHALSQDLYTDQAAEFFSMPSSSWNTMDYDTYYDDWSWQDDPWQAYPEVDPWTGYAEDEWWQEDDSWSPTASEWHTPEEYVIHDDQHETEQAAEAPETYYEDEDYYQQKSGCHVCGSRWHMAAQCPVRDKGKGGYGGGKSSWRPKGKGKGKGKKGKGKSKSFKGKGKFKGGNKGYFNDIDYSAQRSQPEQGLSRSPPASSSFTTEVKPIHMTPPRIGELLPWQEKKVTFAEDQEDEEAPAPSEPVRKQLAFATHLHASSEVYHMVKGIKRRGLLIDPGAAAGLVGSETLRDLLASCYQDKQKAVTWSASDATITGISGQPDKALGRVHLKLPFKNMEATYTADVIGKEGSRCPALVGNPALCAMYASLHSRWFTNDDGLLVAWDTSKSEHPQMNLFRVLFTDSGHYLLPLDEDAGICDQQPEAFHFIKHLSDVSHRAWPDHAYTFWQNVTAQGPERQWSTHGTRVRSLQDDHPLTSLMSEQNKNHDTDTSCSTSPIKDHDTSTLPITSSTSDITSTGGVEAADNLYQCDDAHKEHKCECCQSHNTPRSTTPEQVTSCSTTATSCSTTPGGVEAADKDYQERKDSVVTSQLMATNLSELPLYVDDSVPPHLSQEDQQKLKKDYKAMPEEFYRHSNRRVVTPDTFPAWFKEAKRHGVKWQIWELFSGSGRFSLLCTLAGLMAGFPVDFRYGWDIGNPAHQDMLWSAYTTFEPEVIFGSPRCKFWSIAASRRDRHQLLQDREKDRSALVFLQRLYAEQVKKSRGYLLEQPLSSAMWEESVMAENKKFPGWRKHRRTDQCAFGAVDELRKPVLKATGIEANFKLRLSLRRCNGHNGMPHAPLQGQHQGKNRTAMAAVYPTRFCKALIQDIIQWFQKRNTLHMRLVDSWTYHQVLYKCERCKFGRAATADMEHSFIPGECRHGRMFKEPSAAPSAASSPTADFQRGIRAHGGMSQVEIQVPDSMEFTAEDKLYLKGLLCQLVNDSMTIFDEVTDGNYSQRIEDPILMTIVRSCLRKILYVHGVYIILHPFAKAFPEPKLRAELCPLRLICRGTYKSWTVHPLEDHREMSPAQQREAIEEPDWMITFFGDVREPTSTRRSSPATPAPVTPAPGTPMPGTPAPLMPVPATPMPPAEETSQALVPVDDAPLQVAPYEGISAEAANARAIKPLYSVRRVLQKLPSIAASDPTQAKRLLLGLHEKMWHATAADFTSLLQRAGMPQAVLDLIGEAVASCAVCRRYSRLPSKPKSKATLAAQFNDEVEMDIYFLWGKAFVLLIDVATRYKVAFETPTRSLDDLLRGMLAHWIRYFGPMRMLTSDQETSLMGPAAAIEFERLAICRNPKGTTQGEAAKQHTGTGLAERHIGLIKLTMEKVKAELDRQGLTMEDADIAAESAMCQNLLMTYGGYTPCVAVFGVLPRSFYEFESTTLTAVDGARERDPYIFESAMRLRQVSLAAVQQAIAEDRVARASHSRPQKVDTSELTPGTSMVEIHRGESWRGPAVLLEVNENEGTAIVRHQGKPYLLPLRFVRPFRGVFFNMDTTAGTTLHQMMAMIEAAQPYKQHFLGYKLILRHDGAHWKNIPSTPTEAQQKIRSAFGQWEEWAQHPVHGVLYGQACHTPHPLPHTRGTILTWLKGTSDYIKIHKEDDNSMKLKDEYGQRWESLCVMYIFYYPTSTEMAPAEAPHHKLPGRQRETSTVNCP